jgi:hypothetical protein
MKADSYPTRGPVYWYTTESGQVIIEQEKSLKRFERLLAHYLKAPKKLQRPLDEMNSMLWKQMNGNIDLAGIVARMDFAFAEKISPVNERVVMSIMRFLELELAVIIEQPGDLSWDVGPGIDHSPGNPAD